MAYSKSKFVEAAQKLLNQGKVPQAIAEYQQILKYEPKDQVTLMTIGELYIRQGETVQAMDYFERLAQLFVGDGFLTKAIAVYKRIAKLAPEEIRPLEKLADLYVQQGVMSEARPLFLQLAEIHLKTNRKPEAVALLKKLLLAEPDNLRIQIRLADLYTAMGQTKDAIEAYVSAAQRALARGDQAECEKLADRALKLDPKNQAAVIVKARIHSSQGNTAEAAKTLETVADLHKGGEQTELLLDLYLKDSNWEEAVSLAVRVYDADEKNFAPAQKVVQSLLQAGEGEQALGVVKQIYPAMAEAGDKQAVGQLLSDLAAALPARLEPLEWLIEFSESTKDSSRLPDALARLGDLLVGAKKYDRAKEIFEKLVQNDPSDASKRKLNAVLKKLGHKVPAEPPARQEEESAAVELTLKAAPKLPTEMDSDAPEVRAKPAADSGDAHLDEETQNFITQSLTDVDLFASYGLAHKAMGLLEAILRRAPHHTPTLEKLLDFVLGSGDDKRTAELAAQLEQLHTERGDVASAERFAELRKRFQRAAGLSDEQIAATVTPTPQAPAPEPEATAPEIVDDEVIPASATPEEQPSGGEEVHEVDLSDEWASLLKESQPSEPAAPSKKAHATPQAAASSDVAEFEIPFETPEVSEEDLTDQLAAQAPPPEPPPPPKKAHAAPAPKAKEKPKPAEPEPEADQDYELVLESQAKASAKEQKPPKAPPRAPAPAAPAAEAHSGLGEDFLADLAQELDQLGIGISEPTPPGPPPARSKAASGKNSAKAPAPPIPPTPMGGGPLQEVFDEFRAELGEMGVEDEDLETHYNLGIAFREMGLLEEAISEFQKVAQASDRGRDFRYSMQCSTLLGVTFMQKGQPAVAAIWYERALQTPDLDPESALALRYDLGVAQESAGELDAALKSFSQVYARNIDYRDVGERIAALQKPAR
jgi:tetratricopeptide (TPR) repeat protein